jgi:hypothetical protein
MALADDPIVNLIHNGIKEPIRLLAGVDRFLIAVFSDPERSRLANERLDNMFHPWPVPGSPGAEKV